MRTKQVEIPVSVRIEVGKGAARRLRRAGCIPAVIYGRGMDSLPVSVDQAAFLRALPDGAWFSTLVTLQVEGARESESIPAAMITEVQRDLAQNRVLSIDFHRVSLGEVIRAHIPITHIGQSPGVKHGGILEQILHEVEVECLPTQLPDHLELDVSDMSIGDALRVRNLAPPPGVKIMAGEDEVLLIIAPPAHVEEVAAPAPEVGAVVEEAEEPEVVRKRETEE